MVVSARNPVHSVLFLILAFFNAAALFLIAGAEFLAMILVIVYVGAVAVLFLFVVMMLDVDFAELRSGLPALSAGRRGGRRGAAHRASRGAWRLEVRPAAPRCASRRRRGVSNTEALGRCSTPTTSSCSRPPA
jgi:NADH-quinone oxidoreductase subunit J